MIRPGKQKNWQRTELPQDSVETSTNPTTHKWLLTVYFDVIHLYNKKAHVLS